jgi:hypothetical protein
MHSMNMFDEFIQRIYPQDLFLGIFLWVYPWGFVLKVLSLGFYP